MPIYTLGFAIIYCTKKYNGYLLLVSVALAFAVFSFAIDPSEDLDLYRHYERIVEIGNLPFQSIISLDNINSGYLLFDIYAWFITNLGLPKEFFTATTVFIAYFLMLSIFKDIKNRYLSYCNRSTIAYSLIILLLSINFIYLSSGIRNILANIIVFYACYHLIFYKKRVLFLINVIIAFLIHPASLIPAMLVLITYTGSWFSKYSKPMVILALLFMLGNKLVGFIISYIDTLASSLPFYSATYLDSDSLWGGGFKEYASLQGWIASYIVDRLPTYISLVYLLIFKPRQKDTLYLLLCVFLLVLSIVFSYQTIFSRINYFYIFAFSVFIIIQYSEDKNSFNRNFMLAYLGSLIIIVMVTSYSFIDYLSTAKEVFYKPLLFILAGI